MLIKIFICNKNDKYLIIDYNNKSSLYILILSLFNSYLTFNNFNLSEIIQFLIYSSFIIIIFVDLYEMIIPDTIILFDLILIIIFYIFKNNAIFILLPFKSFEIITSICFVIILLCIVIFYQIVLKKEIFGYGDIKLLFVMGLMIGISKLLYCLFIASFVALIIQLYKKREKSIEFPFGPYLILGFIVVNLLL
mgnify:CR=1 FL=1